MLRIGSIPSSVHPVAANAGSSASSTAWSKRSRTAGRFWAAEGWRKRSELWLLRLG